MGSAPRRRRPRRRGAGPGRGRSRARASGRTPAGPRSASGHRGRAPGGRAPRPMPRRGRRGGRGTGPRGSRGLPRRTRSCAHPALRPGARPTARSGPARARRCCPADPGRSSCSPSTPSQAVVGPGVRPAPRCGGHSILMSASSATLPQRAISAETKLAISSGVSGPGLAPWQGPDRLDLLRSRVPCRPRRRDGRRSPGACPPGPTARTRCRPRSRADRPRRRSARPAGSGSAPWRRPPGA